MRVHVDHGGTVVISCWRAWSSPFPLSSSELRCQKLQHICNTSVVAAYVDWSKNFGHQPRPTPPGPCVVRMAHWKRWFRGVLSVNVRRIELQKKKPPLSSEDNGCCSSWWSTNGHIEFGLVRIKPKATEHNDGCRVCYDCWNRSQRPQNDTQQQKQQQQNQQHDDQTKNCCKFEDARRKDTSSAETRAKVNPIEQGHEQLR